jgi:hypothetical protein
VTPQQAYDAINSLLSTSDDMDVWEAWNELDMALRADGPLPQAWERLTQQAAGERAGKTGKHWGNLSGRGFAPAPDGQDSAGRNFWHPATVDAWTSGDWKAPKP